MVALCRISEPLLMNFEDSWFSDPIITAPNTFSSSFARANNYYFLTDPGANPDKCNLNYRRRQLTRYRQEFPVAGSTKQRVSWFNLSKFVAL